MCQIIHYVIDVDQQVPVTITDNYRHPLVSLEVLLHVHHADMETADLGETYVNSRL